METFLDKRYAGLCRLVLQVAESNGTVPQNVFFCGKTVDFECDSLSDLAAALKSVLNGELPCKGDSLESLEVSRPSIFIGGVEYYLDGSLEAKAALAASGILGAELVQMGKRCLADVSRRKARDKVRSLYKDVESLWGKWASKVWHLRMPVTRRPKIAKAALAVLGLKTVPHTQAAARRAGAALPWLDQDEWRIVVSVVKRLKGIRPQKPTTAAAETKATETKPEAQAPKA